MIITGKLLRDAIISGANNISRQRQAVDELNVRYVQVYYKLVFADLYRHAALKIFLFY